MYQCVLSILSPNCELILVKELLFCNFNNMSSIRFFPLTAKVALIIIVLSVATPYKAQLSGEAEISLLTCRAGDDIYNTFGHTAIRVRDPKNGKDEIYNYGLFNFRTPNFTMKFLRGKLKYQLGIQTYIDFLREYEYQKRSVFEQRLALDSIQKVEIYNALRTNYKPKNRAYLYDFFFDNCSTRPRDLLLVDFDNISFQEPQNQKSFRDLLDEYVYAKPWTDFGIDLIIGSIADEKAATRDQMFLPEYLYKHLEEGNRNGKSLVENSIVVLNHEAELSRRSQSHFFTPVLLFGILLLLEFLLFLKPSMFSKKSWIRLYDKLWFFTIGIGSLVLVFMWFLTDHIATKNNLNLLWMHPLFLFLLFKTKKTFLQISLILCCLALLVSPFIQALHPAVILIICLLIIKIIRLLKHSELTV